MNYVELSPRVELQISQMVERQNSLQLKVATDWVTKGWDFNMAALSEIAEFNKSYWMPWWSKSEQDLVNCRIELVDAWHFIMCDLIVANEGSVDGAAGAILDALNDVNQLDDEDYSDTVQVSKWVMIDLCDGNFSVTSFFALCQSIDFSFDELFALYMAKNALNGFRQKHGYKQGTYKKLWDGNREDNWFLTQWVSDKGAGEVPTMEQTEAWLEDTYAAMLQQFHAPKSVGVPTIVVDGERF